ncbi:MAG TPA: type IX secretion system protein PorQ [Sediminibacterium sp.]|nr:type IX secretion system protein PorQ [Sediminibacterium sp.]
MQNRILLLLIFIYTATRCTSQTLGGNAVFNFLTQPNTAQLSALGGINISSFGNDVGMAFHNPALLQRQMSRQVNTSFNAFIAGISHLTAATALHLPGPGLNLGLGVQYLNYGSLVQTDASGNILGNIRPNDYMIQVMVSRPYMERFRVGVTAKLIHSAYGNYRSSGIAADIGLSYTDTTAMWQASVLVKNMGMQLKTYAADGQKEELPFDIQAGISKKLANAPIQFSLTAHHLHRLNIRYNDTAFNATEGDIRNNGLQKIFAHLVLSSQIYLSDFTELSLGYNFLRRQDLNVFGAGSGLNGFSCGAGILLRKLHIRYATGFYQQHMFHQFSLNFNFSGTPL